MTNGTIGADATIIDAPAEATSPVVAEPAQHAAMNGARLGPRTP